MSMMSTSAARSVGAAVLVSLSLLPARAQTAGGRPSAPGAGSPIPIDIQADRLQYRDNNKFLEAVGNVVISESDTILQADFMSINTETYDVYGRGNVDILHEGARYQIDEFNYNLRTRRGDFEDVQMQQGPWRVAADTTERLSQTEFLLRNATITTCDDDPPEFYVRTKETLVVAGEELVSRHVIFYLGGIPFFYLPYARRDLSSTKSNIDITPGYSDRWGGFVLTAYNYRFNDWLEAATKVDYRSRRGWGFGQDFRWKDWGEDDFEGEFRAYYIPTDDMPFEDEEDEARTGDLVDEERYRFKLRHRQNLSDLDTVRLRSDYLSDPDVLEDFFDREFRENVQPENFATWTRWKQDYIASLTVNSRVNDFYTNVNRIPEFQFDVPRLQLGGSSFYYTSLNRASFLEVQFADQLANRKDYDSGRIDSDNTILYYTKQFGFLNLIPRTRYAGTYYSASPDIETTSVSTISTNELGEVAETITQSTQVVDGGSEYRNVFEVGLEASYKAYKVLDNRPHGAKDVGRRHVFEPFINYAYVPEPNIEPLELYQFDTIDQRDETHDLFFGVRNKLQTKRDGSLHDLIDLVVFSNYNVEQVNLETEDIEFVAWDMDFRWFPRLLIELDGFYDVPNSQLDTFNTRGTLEFAGLSALRAEHRYRKDSRDLVAAQLDLWPEAKWSYAGYIRYDLQLEELEEHSHFLVRRTKCLGLGVGGRQIDDEWTAWAQIWLLAFPKSVVDLGR